MLNKVSKVPCGNRGKTIKCAFEMSNSSKYNDKDKTGSWDREWLGDSLCWEIREDLSDKGTWKLRPEKKELAIRRAGENISGRGKALQWKQTCCVHGQEEGQCGQSFMSKEVNGTIWTQRGKQQPGHRGPKRPAFGLEFYSKYNGKSL